LPSERNWQWQDEENVRIALLHGSIGRLMVIDGGLSDAERRNVFALVNFERPLAYRTFMRQGQACRAGRMEH